MTSKVIGTTGIEFPDATVQSSAALTAFIGANQSLAANGYQKLPGGLIVQWGTGTIPINGVNLPLATPFTTTALACVATVVDTTSSVSVIATINGPANPFFYVFNTVSGASIGGYAIRYITIGY